MVRGTCSALCGLSLWMLDPRFLTLGPSRSILQLQYHYDGPLLCAGERSRKPFQLRVFGRAMFLAIKHFLQDLYHMLVRMDNKLVVSYINHKCGFRSGPLFRLVQQIQVHPTQGGWQTALTEGTALIKGHLNLGAEVLSRQGLRPGIGKSTLK